MQRCHESGSDLVGTVWNGAVIEAQGAGDTRPYSLTSVTARFHGNARTISYPNHFYPVDCGECHVVPPANGATATGSAYQNAWTFAHSTPIITRPSTRLMCHPGGVPG